MPKKLPIEERKIRALIATKADCVFSTTQGEIEGRVIRNLKYEYIVETKNGREMELEKYRIEYRYRRKHTKFVLDAVEIVPEVEDLELGPLRECAGRYRVNWPLLKRCARLRIPVRLIFRSGDSFTGPIRWFGRYEIAIELGRRPEVVGYFHALYDFQPQKPVPSDLEVSYLPVDSIDLVHPRHLTTSGRNTSYEKFLREVRRTRKIAVPLVVHPHDGTGRYALIDGMRRLVVAKRVGLSTVPAYVLQGDPA
jgi:sRNA-binding regulator protein Hfq